MAKFKLTAPESMDNEEVALQFEFGPPPQFKTIDDASDWALTNLPYGVYIQIHDGRKQLRAKGVNSLTLATFGPRKRKQ